MATLSRKAFNAYRDVLRKVRDNSSQQVRDAIDMLDWSSPQRIRTSKARLVRVLQTVIGQNADAYIEAMLQFGNVYQSAQAAAEMQVLAEGAMDGRRTVDAEPLKSTVDYNAQKLAIGDYGGFRDAIADHAGMYTKQVAFERLGRGFALSSRLSSRQARQRVRSGLQIAWIPSGDTCAFCIALASRGWQPARYERFGDYAEHVHAHCDCELVFRASPDLNVEGYDVDELREIYYDRSILPPQYQGVPDDEVPWQERINAIRRAQYADPEIGDRIREQHREQYAATHPHDDK